MGWGINSGSVAQGGTVRDTLSLATTTGLLGEDKLKIDPRSIPIWQASTTYKVGDKVQPQGLNQIFDWDMVNSNSYTYGILECIVAGISGSSPPTIPAVNATVVDNGVTWTYREGQRRVLEIWDISSAGRTVNVPVSWFDVAGGFRSYRGIILGGTSNAKSGESFTLFPALVPNTGLFGGCWISIISDGGAQVGIGWNSYGDSTSYPFHIADGTPLIPASQKSIFAIGRVGGLFYTGTAGGHTLITSTPESDTGFGMSIQPDPSTFSLSVYNGSVAAKLGGKLSNNTSPVSNGANASDSALKSYTLPANALNSTNKGIKITAWGSYVNNGDTKTIKYQVGSQTVVTKLLRANSAGNWKIEVFINRTGTNTQDIFATATDYNGTSVSDTDASGVAMQAASVAGTQTDTSTIVNRVVCTVTTASSITHKGHLVEYFN